MFYSQIASRLFNTPLLVDQGKLGSIISVLAPRFQSGVDAAMPRGNSSARASAFLIEQGVAVISVVGTLVARAGGMDAESGLLSYAELSTNIEDALTHPEVKAILLDIDSPGGEASGAFDVADMLYEARGSKPMVAVANSLMASAAYAIGSAADEVIAGRMSSVGSIGVITAHVDRSAYDEKQGLKYTIVHAGAHKADLNPHAPLSEAARDELQKQVDQVQSIFVSTVARNRKTSPAMVSATEARVYMGVEAVNQGLADRVGTLADAFEGLRGRIASQGTKTTIFNSQMEKSMSADNTTEPTPAPAPSTTPAPDAPSPSPSPTPAGGDGDAASAAAARSEAAAILRSAANLGVEPAFAAGLVESGVSLSAAKAKMVDWLAENKSAPSVRPVIGKTKAAIDESLPADERAKAEWEQSPELRSEFKEQATYLAYRRRELAGTIRHASKTAA